MFQSIFDIQDSLRSKMAEGKKSFLDPYSEEHPIFGPTLKLERISREKLPTQLQLLNLIRGLKKPFLKPGGFIDKSDKLKICRFKRRCK